MEAFNFKTNFIGHDGFVWWIGQIAPNESWIKNFDDVSQIDTELAKSWGIRYKVRIMGYHPYSDAELANDDLPWAQVLATAGNSGSLNTRETVRLNGGDIVVGFFLDGHNAQVPMIMGSFAHTRQWDEEIEKWKLDGKPASAFGVFGGYSEAFEEANYAINKTNTNESTGQGDNGPKNTSITNAAELDESGVPHPVSETNGLEINLCDKGPVSDIKNDVKDMVSQIQGLKARLDDGNEFFRDRVKGIVSSTTESVVRKSGKLVSGMIDDTFNKIAPIGRTGLDKLYKGVYSKVLAATKAPPVAHIAGVAAQTAMLAPLSVAENLIGCLANNIIADLGGMTEDILNSVVDNVFNVTDCVSDQVVGAITNGIVGKVGDGMSGALGGLDKILGFFGGGQGGGFNVENIIRNSTSSIAGAVGLRGCNEPIRTDELGPCRYRLGYGPVSGGDADLKNILGNANAAAALSSAARLTGFPLDGIQDIAGALDIFNSDMKVPGFKSSISNCYSGLPTLCEPPKIRIFGGGGSGAEAIPIFGNIFGDTRYRTGSIIDIKLTNPGNNYQYPPFVEIVDNCNQGRGAQARATIKDGKVNNVYIITEGENYPVSDQPEVVITDINIINPGQNYDEGDTVTDNIGNDYDVTIQNGAIIKVRPLTNIAVEETVQLSINTSTGFDALIFATLGDRPDGEVTQVIDCIS